MRHERASPTFIIFGITYSYHVIDALHLVDQEFVHRLLRMARPGYLLAYRITPPHRPPHCRIRRPSGFHPSLRGIASATIKSLHLSCACWCVFPFTPFATPFMAILSMVPPYCIDSLSSKTTRSVRPAATSVRRPSPPMPYTHSS